MGTQDTALRFAAFEVDRDGVITGWSVAAELMFGLSLSELTDRKLSSLLEGPDPARLLQALPDPNPRAAFMQEMTCRRKNGDAFHASVLVTPLESPAAGPQRLAVLVVDDDRERNRDRFIASVAHDLKQPISVIDTASFILEKMERTGTAQRMLARIKSATTQLSDLATELLDLGTARLGGDIVLEREHLNLIDVFDEVCASLQITHPDRLISIEGADAVDGHWDRKRMRRLAQNLVENALAHSPPGSSIHIACRRVAAEVLLTVENECPTRPTPILENLFEPFRRASENGRAGLGLYISRELARAHGGELGVEWHDGRITFTLSLPIVVATRARDVAPVEPSPAFAVQRRHRRLPFDTELEIGVGDQVFRGHGRDVSLRGLAFYSNVELEIDERVQVGVSMGPTSFRVLGTVRHVNREPGRALVGIEFPCDLSQAEIDLLKKPLRS